MRFLSYAKGSLDETRNHLEDGEDEGYFSNDDVAAVATLIERTLGAISKWRQYLESPAARRFYEQHKAKRRNPEP